MLAIRISSTVHRHTKFSINYYNCIFNALINIKMMNTKFFYRICILYLYLRNIIKVPFRKYFDIYFETNSSAYVKLTKMFLLLSKLVISEVLLYRGKERRNYCTYRILYPPARIPLHVFENSKLLC